MLNAIVISPRDSVATVIVPVEAGQGVCWAGGERPVAAAQSIPAYHKVALAKMKQGEFVYKYGEKMGLATQDIAPGEHVHTHNVTGLQE